MGMDWEGGENKTKFYVSSRDVRIVCPLLKRYVRENDQRDAHFFSLIYSN